MAIATSNTPAARDRGLFSSVISVTCCIIAGLTCWNISPQPVFVKANPTEYGTVMFSIISAGMVGTMAGYIATFFEILRIYNTANKVRIHFAAFLIFIAALSVCFSMYLICMQSNFDSRFEYSDLATIVFAFAGVMAVLLVCLCSDDVRWKYQFWIIELPLFISLFFIIIGKCLVYDQTSSWFNETITTLPYYPQKQPFGYQHIVEHIRNDLRTAFWTGTMAGLVGVQLIIAQIAALGLEVCLKGKSDINQTNKKSTNT